MSVQLAVVSADELATARRRWLAEADFWKHGRCHVCQRLHEDDGHPLIVARRERERLFRCFACEQARRRPKRRAA